MPLNFGLVTDAYFPRAVEAARTAGCNPWVRYNIFLRHGGVMCGMRFGQELISWINNQLTCLHRPQDAIRLLGLPDGTRYDAKEPVALLEGRFEDLAEAETALLGFLTLSGPATGMAELVRAADGVPVVDMATRHYLADRRFSTALTYAAHVGGAAGTSSPEGWLTVQRLLAPANIELEIAEGYRPSYGFMYRFVAPLNHVQDYCRWMQRVRAQGDPRFLLVGTIPHALNAVLGGSIPAAEAFHKSFPEEKLTVLVDYEGRELDMVREAVAKFGKDLYAVRLDTHGDRTHQSGTDTRDVFLAQAERLPCYSALATATKVRSTPIYGHGVTVEAYLAVREVLDGLGAPEVKIVLSSGFAAEKTATFRPFIDPVRTIIGSGSWVGEMNYHPTGDIVEINEGADRAGSWRSCIKVGRSYTPSTRLQLLAGPAC